MEIRKAQREQVKIMLAMQESFCSGKSTSVLLLASGITNYSKIAVIDTGNHSADLYIHLGDYSVPKLSQPLSTERYIKANETSEQEGMEVIIIDSSTHDWNGSWNLQFLHLNRK